MSKREEKCNGWSNVQTWSAALCIDNDYNLYMAAHDFMMRHSTIRKPYASFIRIMGLENEKNENGYKWISTKIDYKELNEYMTELGRIK